MWWGKGTTLPPLVTTSPQGTPFPQAGVLGQPDTSVLFGNQLGGNGMQTGGRVTFGMWLDPQHNVAAEDAILAWVAIRPASRSHRPATPSWRGHFLTLSLVFKIPSSWLIRASTRAASTPG